jgi:nucleoside-diphosphate-sugar epimerase
MAFHRFMNALMRDEPLEVYGDGHQIRGSTYVADTVAATIAAVDAPDGEVYNVGGGEPVSLLEVITKLETVTERKAELMFKAPRIGDQRQTMADTSKLRNHLRWEPKVSLDTGLLKQWQWQTEADQDMTPGPACKMVVPSQHRWSPGYSAK